MKGTLYIVSTPIGNLEDITLRALRVLKDVDIIAAEDTRHSAKLLSHYGISKTLLSYWGEREKAKAEQVLKHLREGRSVALISDSGTPGISDPGAVVIKRAIEEGFSVVPVPGPSAVIAGLSVSGLPTKEFTFIGFLPEKHSQRQKALRDLSFEERTLVFYEAPHRLIETLKDMKGILGNRQACLIREITKLHEEALRGSLSDIISVLESRSVKGEYVIIISGREREKASLEEAIEEVRMLVKKGIGRKEAVRIVANQYGLSKGELYELSLGKGEI